MANSSWWLNCPVFHTRFQISNKEFFIMSMKDISVQLELKYTQKQNLKIKRSHFVLDGAWLIGCLVLWWLP